MTKDSSTLDRLQRFSYRVQELRHLRLVRSGMDVRFSIHWDYILKSLRYQMPKVDEDDLRSFLLLFRQFVSKGEPIFMDRIFNDCERFLMDDHLKEQVRRARIEWKSTFNKMGPISMRINNRDLTGDYVLGLYINGHYFHNDTEKAAELHRLLGDFIPLLRVKFLEVLSTLTQIILYMGMVVSFALDKNLFRIPGTNS